MFARTDSTSLLINGLVKIGEVKLALSSQFFNNCVGSALFRTSSRVYLSLSSFLYSFKFILETTNHAIFQSISHHDVTNEPTG